VFSDALNRVRQATDRTRGERRARVRYRFGGPDNPGPEDVDVTGTVDFVMWRVELPGQVEVQGQRSFLHDGEWRGPVGERGDPLTPGSPLWLLEALRGAREILERERDGAFVVAVDLVAADAASPVRLASPGGFALSELVDARFRVDLDDEDRVREVALMMTGTTTALTLEEFGDGADPGAE
jgi:hypothetical protein